MKFSLKFRIILAALFLLVVLAVSTVLVFRGDEADAEVAGFQRSASPGGEYSISAAELQDLQAIAEQDGISLQEAIDWYAWRNNFSQAVSKIREAAAASFAGSEIVGQRPRVGRVYRQCSRIGDRGNRRIQQHLQRDNCGGFGPVMDSQRLNSKRPSQQSTTLCLQCLLYVMPLLRSTRTRHRSLRVFYLMEWIQTRFKLNSRQ